MIARLRTWVAPALFVTLLAAPPSAANDASSTNVIEFKTRPKSNGGVVRCGLFEREGWLKKTIRADIAKINGKSALCLFKEVPKGVYGISAFHDENNNGELDTNLVGMPVEDYCASNNARRTFGPPSFEDAKFDYTGGTKTLSAQLK